MKTIETVTSVDEMIDKSKAYALNGTIWQYGARVNVEVPYNRIPLSINSDGTPYNGGQGWKTNTYLVASNGAEAARDGYEVSGFIPFTADDIFLIENYGLDAETTLYNNMCLYDSSFAFLGIFTANSTYNPLLQFQQENGSLKGSISTAATTNITEDKKKNIAYMRLSFRAITAETSCVLNLFEEKIDVEAAKWYDTKIPYYGDMVNKMWRYMGLHA